MVALLSFGLTSAGYQFLWTGLLLCTTSHCQNSASTLNVRFIRASGPLYFWPPGSSPQSTFRLEQVLPSSRDVVLALLIRELVEDEGLLLSNSRSKTAFTSGDSSITPNSKKKGILKRWSV
jgi:hypothetical protein